MKPGRALRWLVVVLTSMMAIGGFVSCASENKAILTVNGWELGRHDFLVELDQIAKNPGYIAARQRNGQPFKVFKDGSTEEYTPEFVAEFLNERVTFQLAEAEVAARNLKVTEADRQRAVEVIVDGFSSGVAPGTEPTGPQGTAVPAATPGTVAGAAAPSGRAVLDAFGSYREVLINGVANLQVLQRAQTDELTTDDQLKLLYERLKDQYATHACARHILIRAGAGQLDPTTGNAIPGTETEYAAALDRLLQLREQLEAGVDFATVAKESSEDIATKEQGGDLGCAGRDQYADAFEQAVWNQPVNQLGPPVKTTYGYHLVLVTDRRTRSFDEVKQQLKQAVADQSEQALQDWLARATQSATVTVDPQFGVWNASKGTIEAAAGGSPLSLVPQRPNDTVVVPTAPPGSPAPAVPR